MRPAAKLLVAVSFSALIPLLPPPLPFVMQAGGDEQALLRQLKTLKTEAVESGLC